MKHTVRILALALAALTLVACANTPAPVVTDENTTAATTIDVPSTTEVPATTDTPETTAAPATTEAPATTVVPVTTAAPSTTAAPVTTKAPEITFENEYTHSVEEPFYWIDETHVGVRGFDGVIFTTEGSYITADYSYLQAADPMELSGKSYYSLSHLPQIVQTQESFRFCEKKDWRTVLLYFSDQCILRVDCTQRFHSVYDHLSEQTIFSGKHFYEEAHSYYPIFKSNDGKNVRYIEIDQILGDLSLTVLEADLTDDLRHITQLKGLSGIEMAGWCKAFYINGKYGLLIISHGTGTREGTDEKLAFFSVFATDNAGETWNLLDLGNSDTPCYSIVFEIGKTTITKK